LPKLVCLDVTHSPEFRSNVAPVYVKLLLMSVQTIEHVYSPKQAAIQTEGQIYTMRVRLNGQTHAIRTIIRRHN